MFVYFMQTEDYVKIGVTNNLQKRLQQKIIEKVERVFKNNPNLAEVL